MDKKKSLLLLCVLLLTCPKMAGGGPICSISCMSVIGIGGVTLGAAVLPLLGFTSSGIAAGSWAAWIMSWYGGAVPAGSWFAFLQSAGASGGFSLSWASFGGISGFCTALCAPFP